MDIRQLRYFVAIADQHSMSLASEKLGVAQPSLSHHVMRIEEELGVKLLVRSTRGVTMTESGRRLYTHARMIIKAVEEAVADLRDDSADICGPVSFAFPSSVSNVLTVPLSETVRNEFPKIVLSAMDATSAQVQAWLTEGSIDFGILYDAHGAREIDVQPLLSEDLYLVAARDYWRGEIHENGVAKEPVLLRDCRDLGLILPNRADGLRETVERCAEAQNLQLRVVLEMDSLSRIKTLVSRGSGYSILAHAAVHEELERRELVLVPIREPGMRRTVDLATNPARPAKRAAKEVERLAVAIVSELVRKRYGSASWRRSAPIPATPNWRPSARRPPMRRGRLGKRLSKPLRGPCPRFGARRPRRVGVHADLCKRGNGTWTTGRQCRHRKRVGARRQLRCAATSRKQVLRRRFCDDYRPSAK